MNVNDVADAPPVDWNLAKLGDMADRAKPPPLRKEPQTSRETEANTRVSAKADVASSLCNPFPGHVMSLRPIVGASRHRVVWSAVMLSAI